MKKNSNNFLKNPFWLSFIAIIVFAVAVAGILTLNKPASQQEVFKEAINNQLNSANIYRAKEVNEGQASQTQLTAVSFNKESGPVSRDFVQLTNNTPGQKMMVETEGVGAQNADYIKYVKIKGEGSDKAQTILGKWAKNEATDTQSAQFLETAIFASPLITGPVSSKVRAEINNAVNNGAIEVVGNVDTTGKINGKNVYKYKVNFNLKKYIPLFQSYLKDIGMVDAANKLTVPAKDSSLPLVIYVDPVTKKIIKTESGQETQGAADSYVQEKFILPPSIPTKIGVSVKDLQQALSGQ